MIGKFKYIKRFIVFMLSLVISFKIFQVLFLQNSGLEWAIPAFAILSASLISEAWMSLRGRKTVWQYFNARDKVVFFFAMTVFLLFLTFPERMQLTSRAGFLIGLVGLLLSWLLVRHLGSPGMKEVMFGLTSSRQFDPDFENSE
jgi:hypothetical protein